MKNSFLLLLLISAFVSAQSQVEIDTHPSDSIVVADRYIDYSNQLLLKYLIVTKLSGLEIVNSNNNQSINLEPFGISSMGFGFNYKWLGLGVTFGVPLSAEQEEMYGKTKRFDFQLNIYSQKFVIDAFFQQYEGFYVTNPSSLTTWTETFFPRRETMKTATFGVGGYYVFNHKKLSYKAAYVRNAVQKKSAGSFLLGGFYNIDYAGFPHGDTSSFVPENFPKEVQDSFPINAFTSTSFGVSIGYTYTFVFFKNFFINLSLIPGFGTKNLEVYKSGEKFTETSPMGRFNGRVALGYDSKHFLIGVTSNTLTGTLNFQDYQIKPQTKNIKFFIAKRFNLKKKKNKVPSE